MSEAEYYVGFSTKAYFGWAQTGSWLRSARNELDARAWLPESGIVPFVIPSFPALAEAVAALDGTGALVGAQTVGSREGAVTGEVPARMLAELGVRIVEIGHAERRANFGESDDVIRRKVSATAEAGLRPLLCIGETAAGDPRAAAEFCVGQIRDAGVAGVPGVLLAYEPVWAIGAAAPAPAAYTNAVLAGIRARLDGPAEWTLLYGGSAGPDVVGQLHESDGVFLGRFAHQAAAFGRVLDEAAHLSARRKRALARGSDV